MAVLNKARLALNLMFIIFMCSCKPSLNDCEKCLISKHNDAIQIVSINKKNGVQSEKEGYSVYDIYFSCTIEFIKDYDVRSAAIGIIQSYKKGDKFDIENAHAQFVKTDNGWMCVASDYDVLNGYYYIDKSGRRYTVDDYYNMKDEEEQRRPKCFTGSIDNYNEYAALNVRVSGSNISAMLYDKQSKKTQSVNGYISNDQWVIKITNNIRLEGRYNGEWYEGTAIDNGNRVGRFSFRQVSFDWEKTKSYEAPTIKVNKDIPVSSPVPDYEDNDTITCVIANDRAYFHDRPEAATKRKAYLVKDEAILVQKEKNGFVYVEFENQAGIVTKGWINSRDIEIVE